MIQLTLEDAGTPPLLVNPAYVSSLKPRRKLVPNQASQTAQVDSVWTGTLLRMSNGDQHLVREDYEQVHALLSGQASLLKDQLKAEGVPVLANVTTNESAPAKTTKTSTAEKKETPDA